jgi:hypothetical protein
VEIIRQLYDCLPRDMSLNPQRRKTDDRKIEQPPKPQVPRNEKLMNTIQ